MHYYDVMKPPACKGETLDTLLALGWYPMGQSIFTTSHLFRDEEEVPRRVHWLRYHVDSVNFNGSHRRILKKNQNYSVSFLNTYEHSDELNRLYDTYLDSVDFDGYESVEKATYAENESNIYLSKAVIVKDEDRIISCGIFHEGKKSVASVLHFYDPNYKKYSPGKFLILQTLQYCKEQNLEWYYPGYVIEGNSKMNYKLFLGSSLAQYYLPEPHPLYGSWQPFDLKLL